PDVSVIVLFSLHDALPICNSPLSCLLAQLEGWIASYGRVRLYTGVSMVEVADNLVMRELSATTSLEEQIVKSITPTLMILTKQRSEEHTSELQSLAYLVCR